MGFRQIPRIPVGADLSRPPPIYRPLLAVLIPHIIYETSLSAFAGCSAIPINLLNLIISPRAPSTIQITNLQSIIGSSALPGRIGATDLPPRLVYGTTENSQTSRAIVTAAAPATSSGRQRTGRIPCQRLRSTTRNSTSMIPPSVNCPVKGRNGLSTAFLSEIVYT